MPPCNAASRRRFSAMIALVNFAMVLLPLLGGYYVLGGYYGGTFPDTPRPDLRSTSIEVSVLGFSTLLNHQCAKPPITTPAISAGISISATRITIKPRCRPAGMGRIDATV